MNLYALHDWDTELKTKFGAFPVPEPEAESRNREGYGIYFTANDFTGPRKTENITRINFWMADIDAGTKPEQMARIDKLILRPSKIIESKRGYHLYWAADYPEAVSTEKTQPMGNSGEMRGIAEGDSTVLSGVIVSPACPGIENYRTIQEGIIEKTGADPAVKDPARLMRAPGYYHQKDKTDPFLVRAVFQSADKYTEKEMLYAFPKKKSVRTNYAFDRNLDKSEMLDPANWNRIFHLDGLTNGNRNNELFRISMWLHDTGFPASTIRETIFGMNNRLANSLPENEVETILRRER